MHIGTAGWAISQRCAASFGTSGTQLERYARVLSVSEINSSAYRSHRFDTYVRWRESVPENFRFSVKLPQALTHRSDLKGDSAALDRFAVEVSGLGAKLAVLLVQLPPSQTFEASTARRFFSKVGGRIPARIACEPRNSTWGSQEADFVLQELGIARVAADPPRWETNASPAGDRRLSYFRMHGSPRMYFSEYSQEQLGQFSEQLKAAAATSSSVWCIFDNTAHGQAIGNALHVKRQLA
jgi:uncharacterized protein YecE (DUF72 family)